MKKFILYIFLAVGLIYKAPAAVLVDNSLCGYASGRLGSQSFFSAAFTVSSIAETASVLKSGGNYTLSGLTTITIDGIGTATFNGGDSFGFKSILVNPSFQSLQFQDLTTGNSIFEVSLMFELSYPNLTTPITSTGNLTVRDGHASPVLGDGIYSTTLGNLEFSSAYGTYSSTATFSTAVIPEPSTYALFSIGAIGMLMVMTRKKV